MGTRSSCTYYVRKLFFRIESISTSAPRSRFFMWTTIIHVLFVQAATLSASVRTAVLSKPIENNPEEVGSSRPCPGGIATAEIPSLKFSDSVIKTNRPFSRSITLNRSFPLLVSESNSLISSKPNLTRQVRLFAYMVISVNTVTYCDDFAPHMMTKATPLSS